MLPTVEPLGCQLAVYIRNASLVVMLKRVPNFQLPANIQKRNAPKCRDGHPSVNRDVKVLHAS
jgi:hypothetical protein